MLGGPDGQVVEVKKEMYCCFRLGRVIAISGLAQTFSSWVPTHLASTQIFDVKLLAKRSLRISLPCHFPNMTQFLVRMVG